MVLPTDGHVHSEWSWDAPRGSMERTCARAVELGLPGVAFTEHIDFTAWRVEPGELDGFDHLTAFVTGDTLTPPPMDVAGYRRCVERCREAFPGLRIITGVELGEAHRHSDAAAELLAAGQFERVLGSLHALRVGDRNYEPPGLFRQWTAGRVIREYLAEVRRMVEESDAFAVLTHITYPVRHWPAAAGDFDPTDFEPEFREALRALGDRGRALEINTTDQFYPQLLRWWVEEGGRAVTFGSDAHEPDQLGRRLADAARFAEEHGFRAGAHPYDFWTL